MSSKTADFSGIKGRRGIRGETPKLNETTNLNGTPNLNESQSSQETKEFLGSDADSESDTEVIENTQTSERYDRSGREKSHCATPSPNRSSSKTVNEPSTQNKAKSNLRTKKNSPNDPESYNKIVKISFFVACVFAFLAFSIPKFAASPERELKNCSFEEMEIKYPEQNSKIWRSLKVGVESIINERVQKPAVYLFVHDGGDHIRMVVHDIASHSSSCFGQKRQPIEVESDDFTWKEAVDDYGSAIEKFKLKIKDGNVIVIANLNDIPADAARALHAICDTHSPIAKDIVIFLTLRLLSDRDEAENHRSPSSLAEETLNVLWGKLNRNELDALITRVTDDVIDLRR